MRLKSMVSILWKTAVLAATLTTPSLGASWDVIGKIRLALPQGGVIGCGSDIYAVGFSNLTEQASSQALYRISRFGNVPVWDGWQTGGRPVEISDLTCAAGAGKLFFVVKNNGPWSGIYANGQNESYAYQVPESTDVDDFKVGLKADDDFIYANFKLSQTHPAGLYRVSTSWPYDRTLMYEHTTGRWIDVQPSEGRLLAVETIGMGPYTEVRDVTDGPGLDFGIMRVSGMFNSTFVAPDSSMYGFPAMGPGRLVRIRRDGSHDEIGPSVAIHQNALQVRGENIYYSDLRDRRVLRYNMSTGVVDTYLSDLPFPSYIRALPDNSDGTLLLWNAAGDNSDGGDSTIYKYRD